MVNFEQALKLAKEYWPEVDSFAEYERAFVFFKSGVTTIGGTSPIAVDKATGRRRVFVSAIGEGLLEGDTIQEGPLPS